MEVSGRRNNDEEEDTLRENEGKLCRRCKEDGDLKRAYGYCNDCEEDLCETCYKYHRRPRPCKDHKLVKHDIEEHEGQEPREETDTEPPPVPERRKYLDTKCHIHNKEELKYHCRSHDAIICSVCALKQHKECKNVDYIPDVLETEKERVVKMIEYVEGKIKYKLKQEMDAVQVAEKSFESSTSAIKAQKGEIDRYFEGKETYFINKITTFRDESKGRQKEIMDLAQKMKKDKSRVTPSSADPDVNKYIEMQEIETNVKNINQKLPGVFANPTLTMSYKQHPLSALGEAAVVEQQGNINKKKMKLLRKVDVKGEKASCCLIDATLVSKGRVVFTDSQNDRLIIISDDYEPVFHECSGKPWGLSCITNTEIVVSFPYKMDLKFYHVNDEVSCSGRNSIKMSQQPCGISYLKPETELIIAVLRQEGSAIESWSLDGQLLRTVVLFKYEYDRLTLTVDRKILCVSAKQHIVRLLELDGTAIKAFKYADENMQGPFGISSDTNGNIYICGFKCLRVVSKDRIWDEIISPEDRLGPQCLAICHSRKELYVGQSMGPPYTEVLIYQI